MLRSSSLVRSKFINSVLIHSMGIMFLSQFIFFVINMHFKFSFYFLRNIYGTSSQKNSNMYYHCILKNLIRTIKLIFVILNLSEENNRFLRGFMFCSYKFIKRRSLICIERSHPLKFGSVQLLTQISTITVWTQT